MPQATGRLGPARQPKQVGPRSYTGTSIHRKSLPSRCDAALVGSSTPANRPKQGTRLDRNVGPVCRRCEIPRMNVPLGGRRPGVEPSSGNSKRIAIGNVPDFVGNPSEVGVGRLGEPLNRRGSIKVARELALRCRSARRVETRAKGWLSSPAIARSSHW